MSTTIDDLASAILHTIFLRWALDVMPQGDDRTAFANSVLLYGENIRFKGVESSHGEQ
jgi:hypothetical protein